MRGPPRLIDRLRSGFSIYPVHPEHMIEAANLLEAQEARIAELEECLGSVSTILRATQSPRQSLPMIQFQLRKALFLAAAVLAVPSEGMAREVAEKSA